MSSAAHDREINRLVYNLHFSDDSNDGNDVGDDEAAHGRGGKNSPGKRGKNNKKKFSKKEGKGQHNPYLPLFKPLVSFLHIVRNHATDHDHHYNHSPSRYFPVTMTNNDDYDCDSNKNDSDYDSDDSDEYYNTVQTKTPTTHIVGTDSTQRYQLLSFHLR
jgi:hypothetical protein